MWIYLKIPQQRLPTKYFVILLAASVLLCDGSMGDSNPLADDGSGDSDIVRFTLAIPVVRVLPPFVVQSTTLPPTSTWSSSSAAIDEVCYAIQNFSDTRVEEFGSSMERCDSQDGRPTEIRYCEKGGVWSTSFSLPCNMTNSEILSTITGNMSSEQASLSLLIVTMSEEMSATDAEESLKVFEAVGQSEKNTVFSKLSTISLLTVADKMTIKRMEWNSSTPDESTFFRRMKNALTSISMKLNITAVNGQFAATRTTFSLAVSEIHPNKSLFLNSTLMNDSIYLNTSEVSVTLPIIFPNDVFVSMLVFNNGTPFSTMDGILLSPLVSLNIGNSSKQSIDFGKETVVIRFAMHVADTERQDYECAYYNATDQDWMREKGRTTFEGGIVICEWTHLTDFALIANESMKISNHTMQYTTPGLNFQTSQGQTTDQLTTRDLMLIACPTEKDNVTNLNFAETQPGMTAMSYEKCNGSSGRPKAIRHCSRDYEWGEAKLNNCSLSNADLLSSLKEVADVEEVATVLLTLLQSTNLSINDTSTSISQLDQVSQSYSEITSSTTDLLLSSAENLITRLQGTSTQLASTTFSQIRNSTMRILLGQQISKEESYSFKGDRFSAKVMLLPSNKSSDLYFGNTAEDEEILPELHKNIAIKIPGAALENFPADDKVVVVFHNNSSPFIIDTGHQPFGPVISIVIGSRKNTLGHISDLGMNKIHLTFGLVSEFESIPDCVYFDTATNQWLTDGGNVSTDGTSIICEWSHLTDFGLVDTSTVVSTSAATAWTTMGNETTTGNTEFSGFPTTTGSESEEFTTTAIVQEPTTAIAYNGTEVLSVTDRVNATNWEVSTVSTNLTTWQDFSVSTVTNSNYVASTHDGNSTTDIAKTISSNVTTSHVSSASTANNNYTASTRDGNSTTVITSATSANPTTWQNSSVSTTIGNNYISSTSHARSLTLAIFTSTADVATATSTNLTTPEDSSVSTTTSNVSYTMSTSDGNSTTDIAKTTFANLTTGQDYSASTVTSSNYTTSTPEGKSVTYTISSTTIDIAATAPMNLTTSHGSSLSTPTSGILTTSKYDGNLTAGIATTTSQNLTSSQYSSVSTTDSYDTSSTPDGRTLTLPISNSTADLVTTTSTNLTTPGDSSVSTTTSNVNSTMSTSDGNSTTDIAKTTFANLTTGQDYSASTASSSNYTTSTPDGQPLTLGIFNSTTDVAIMTSTNLITSQNSHSMGSTMVYTTQTDNQTTEQVTSVVTLTSETYQTSTNSNTTVKEMETISQGTSSMTHSTAGATLTATNSLQNNLTMSTSELQTDFASSTVFGNLTNSTATSNVYSTTAQTGTTSEMTRTLAVSQPTNELITYSTTSSKGTGTTGGNMVTFTSVPKTSIQVTESLDQTDSDKFSTTGVYTNETTNISTTAVTPTQTTAVSVTISPSPVTLSSLQTTNEQLTTKSTSLGNSSSSVLSESTTHVVNVTTALSNPNETTTLQPSSDLTTVSLQTVRSTQSPAQTSTTSEYSAMMSVFTTAATNQSIQSSAAFSATTPGLVTDADKVTSTDVTNITSAATTVTQSTRHINSSSSSMSNTTFVATSNGQEFKQTTSPVTNATYTVGSASTNPKTESKTQSESMTVSTVSPRQSYATSTHSIDNATNSSTTVKSRMNTSVTHTSAKTNSTLFISTTTSQSETEEVTPTIALGTVETISQSTHASLTQTTNSTAPLEKSNSTAYAMTTDNMKTDTSTKVIPVDTKCPAEVVSHNSANLTFIEGVAGELVISEEQCSEVDKRAKAIRYCYRDGEWGNVRSQNCSLTTDEVLGEIVQNISQTSVEEHLFVSNLLIRNTEVSHQQTELFSEFLGKVADMPVKLEKVTIDVFVDSAVRAIVLVDELSNETSKRESLRNLGRTIDKISLKTDVSEGSYRVSKEQFDMTVLPIPSDTSAGLSFSSENTSAITVHVPKSVLDMTEGGSDRKVAIVEFKTALLFPAMNDPASDIVSVSVGDSSAAENISNIVDDPIVIGFQTSNFSAAFRNRYNKPEQSLNLGMTCVFYNYEIQDWSSEGGKVGGSDETSGSCNWSHATSFAVLSVPVFQSVKPDTLVLVGNAFAATLFLVVFSVYIIFWRLRQDPIDAITLNVALTLSLSFLTYLCSSILWGALSRQACLALSALNHFFLLSAFAWLAGMAYVADRCIFLPKKWILWAATADERYTRKLIWKMCGLAYGATTVIWATTLTVWIVIFERTTTEEDGIIYVDGGAYTEVDLCAVKDWALATGLGIPCALVTLYAAVVQMRIGCTRCRSGSKLEHSFRGYLTQFRIAIALCERSIIIPVAMSALWGIQFIRVSFDNISPDNYKALDYAFGISCILLSIGIALLLIVRPIHVRKTLLKLCSRRLSLSEGSYYLDHETSMAGFNSVTRTSEDSVPTINLPFDITVTASETSPSHSRIGIRDDVPGSGFRVKRWRPSDSVAQTDFVLSKGKFGLTNFRERNDIAMTTFGSALAEARQISDQGFDDVTIDRNESKTKYDQESLGTSTSKSEAEKEPTYAKVSMFRKKKTSKVSTFKASNDEEVKEDDDWTPEIITPLDPPEIELGEVKDHENDENTTSIDINGHERTSSVHSRDQMSTENGSDTFNAYPTTSSESGDEKAYLE